MPSTPPDPAQRDRRPAGPYMLRIRGMWGFGKRSGVRIDAADVLDLSSSPDDDRCRSMDASSRVFVPIEEDIEPVEGLDVRFGDQTLRPLGGTQWEIVSYDD